MPAEQAAIDMYLVTIVVLTCNRSKYLLRCLHSIREQNCTRWKLIVSDCSDDLAAKIAVETIMKVFGREHPIGKVTFLKQKQRLCQAKHMEVVFHIVDTKYMALLDDDDFWLERHLDRSLKVLEADCRIGFTTSNGLVVNDKDAINGLTNNSHYIVPPAEDLSGWLEFFLRSFYGSTSAYVIRKKAVQKHMFIRTSCVDIHLAISVLLAGFYVTCFESPSYCYRVHRLSLYKKGYQVIYDRHKLRLHLFKTKGWRLLEKCPKFWLLVIKSFLELTGYRLWKGLAAGEDIRC